MKLDEIRERFRSVGADPSAEPPAAEPRHLVPVVPAVFPVVIGLREDKANVLHRIGTYATREAGWPPLDTRVTMDRDILRDTVQIRLETPTKTWTHEILVREALNVDEYMLFIPAFK